MEEEFRALLIADPTVAAQAEGRVNYVTHPQGQPLPAIVLNLVSDAEQYTLDGRDRLTDARIQVDCYGDVYGDAKRLSRAAQDLLSGYRGGKFQGIFHVGSRDGREGGSNEVERPYRTSMDFIVRYEK